MRDRSPFGPYHASLPDHPKILDLADELGVSEATAVGHMVCLWARALTYAPDGDLSRLSPARIARFAGWTGDATAFATAVETAGFAADGRLHEWDLYAGHHVERLEKERERSRKRRAIARATTVATTVATGDASAVASVARGEERRGEDPPPSPPSGGREVVRFAPDGVDEWLSEVEPATGCTRLESLREAWPALDGHEERPSVREVVTAAVGDDRAIRRARGDVEAVVASKLAAAHKEHRVGWAYEQNADESDPTLTPAARERVRARNVERRERYAAARAGHDATTAKSPAPALADDDIRALTERLRAGGTT